MHKTLKSTLLKKSFVIIIVRGLGVLLLFGLTLFITNHFEAYQVGQYDTSRSILNIFGGLTLLGLNEAIIYYSGVFRAKNTLSSIKALYKKMLLIIVGSAVFFFLLYLVLLQHFISFVYDKNVGDFIFKTFCILGFHALTMLNIDFYRALNKIEISEIFRNIFRYLFFFIAVFVIFQIGQRQLLVDVFLLNYVFLGIASTLFVFRSFKHIKPDSTSQKIGTKAIIKRSFPMSISFLAFILLQSTDILVLGKYEPFSQVAYYARAAQLTQLVAIVLYAVNAVFATKIAELYERKDFVQLKKNIKQATRLIFVLTVPVAIILFLFPEFFLSFFGEGYTEAGTALSILLVGQIINSTAGSIGMYMNMTGEQNRLQVISIIVLVLNLILNILLIPKYGLIGAAVSTASAIIIWKMYCSLYLYFKRDIKTFLH